MKNALYTFLNLSMHHNFFVISTLEMDHADPPLPADPVWSIKNLSIVFVLFSWIFAIVSLVSFYS
jgi:hypothetical protein